MNRMQNIAIIAELIDKLESYGSWCGETHIQKATFFLQEMLSIPLEYNYLLYKHGPFSFELRDELTAMRADDIVSLVENQWPYGPSYSVSEVGTYIRNKYPKTINKYKDGIEFMAKNLCDKGVASLERIATALFVINSTDDLDEEPMVDKICELKPHISREEANMALHSVMEMKYEIS